jgi:hypothetical protein
MLCLRLVNEFVRNNRDPSHPRRRAGYAVAGAITGGVAALIASRTGKPARTYALTFLLLPDVPFVLGLRPAIVAGELYPGMVPAYNATHRLAGAAACCAAAPALRSPAVGVAGLAWLTHICFDRAVGFGLRAPDGRLRSRSLARDPEGTEYPRTQIRRR